MSPNTLRKLREWLTIEETASELSTALSEDVDASDVLRLVLDGQLQLSIYLPAKTTARCRKLDDDAPDAPWTRRTIDGVWDVPMVDRAKSQIEHDYQMLCHRTCVLKEAPVGAWVEQEDLLCQIPPDMGSNFGSRHESEFPQGSVLVVRRPALEAFIRQLVPAQAPTSASLDRPLKERERATLLTVIAALAKTAGIDVSQPSKASGQIEALTIEVLRIRIPARTVENHLKAIPDALERRGKTSD